ncbi:MAG: Cof-type HAD-IIB family hydrolase [Bacillota bacterium]
MNYKMIAIDLDNTLLTSEKEMDGETAELIREADKAGKKVILATGRMFEAALPFLEKLELDTPLITYNGALVKDKNRKVIQENLISNDLTKEVIKFAEDYGLHIHYYSAGNYYYRWENKYAREYAEVTGLSGIETRVKLEDYIERPALKLLIIEDEKKRREYFKSELYKFYRNRLSISSSMETYIEITASNVNKGRALAELADDYNILPEEIIAVGDGYNDLSMLEMAGLGVAMENAPEEVRSKADRITQSNDNQGVAKVLEYLLSCNDKAE